MPLLTKLYAINFVKLLSSHVLQIAVQMRLAKVVYIKSCKTGMKPCIFVSIPLPLKKGKN